MQYAITPKGIGQPVGFRAIDEGEQLAAGEMFTTTVEPTGLVLGANNTLRAVSDNELLERAKRSALDRITAARNTALANLTVEIGDATYDADEASTYRMTGALQMWSIALQGNDPRAPKTIAWLDAGNAVRMLTPQDLTMVAAGAWLAQQAVWARNSAAKVAIEAATTADELKAVEF